MKSAEVADEITAELKKFGRGSKQAHRPSAQDDFGVYTGDLRSVVRAFKARLKPEDGKLIHEIARDLLKKNNTECRQVAYELISGHKPACELLDEKRVEELGQRMDNWACVDNFCSYISGRAWREGRISDALIDRWSKSPDVWWRRAAVVSTTGLNMKSKGGKGDTKRTLRVCQRLVEDTEIMVQKAISWALRELVPWDRESVKNFLSKNDTVISSLVKREVTKKLVTGKKN